MVLYQAIRQHPHINTVQSLLQHSLERCVIFWLFKDGRTSICSIENMKNHSTIISSFGSPHNDRRLPAKDVRCQTTVPDTFSRPFLVPPFLVLAGLAGWNTALRRRFSSENSGN